MAQLAILLLGILLLAAPAQALYRYVDGNGQTVFVDRPDKIPPQYRDRSTAVDTGGSGASLTRPEAAAEANPAAWITPIELYQNLVILPVEIEQGGRRQQLRLLLDTGANRTTLHEGQVMLMAFGDSRPARVTGVGGMQTRGRVVTLDQLRVGPYQISDLPTIVLETADANSPFDGILGNDVLRQLRYTVDFSGMAIHWQQPKP